MLPMRRFINSSRVKTIWRAVSTIPKEGKVPEVDYIGKLRDWRDNEGKNGLIVPAFKRSFEFANQIAVYDRKGEYTYLQLYLSAKKLAFQISNICGGGASLPVACICSPNILSVMTQWACWMSGQVSMPLYTEYSMDIMKAFSKKANVQLIICTEEFDYLGQILAEELDIACCVLDHSFLLTRDELPKSFKKLIVIFDKDVMIEGALNNEFYTMNNALLACKVTRNGELKTFMFNYTNFAAHTKCLQSSLDFTSTDVLLPILPNYHIHDLLNAVFSVGGSIIMPDQENSLDVWKTLLNANENYKHPVNFLYGMPLVYYKLIKEFDKSFAADKKMSDHILNYCKKNIRATVSGFSSLPLLISKRWHNIFGHKILEQYGKIETGVILSHMLETKVNEQKDESDVGIVGNPLPGVEVCIIDKNNEILYTAKGKPWDPIVKKQKGCKFVYDLPRIDEEQEIIETPVYGELLVYGLGIIRKKTLTKEERKNLFNKKFMRTGDLVLYENGVFKIMGKIESDIIQVANQNVFSLQVESILSRHPHIDKVIVGGVKDQKLGERVSAICVLKPNGVLNLNILKEFCSNEELESYKIPTLLKIVEELSSDEIVKPNRKEVVKKYFDDPKNEDF